MAESFDVINAPQYFDFSNSAEDDVDDSFFGKFFYFYIFFVDLKFPVFSISHV